MNPAPRIAVIGAGAIGGVLAARLAAAGHEVGVVARGAQLAAIRERGLRLETEGETGLAERQPVALEATDDAARLGRRDIVFLCLKAHDLGAATGRLAPLLERDTIVVPVQNGIPWWYFEDGRDEPLASADPDGALRRRFERTRLVGCVTHMAAQVSAPGIVRLTADGPILVGDAGTSSDSRAGDAARIGALLQDAGFEAHAVDDIRREIWIKLAGNAAFNPVAALTGATMGEICDDARLVGIVRTAMAECMAVGESCGIAFPVSVEERIAMARKIGGSKLSMLQDLESGRPVEADALIGAVIELGARAGRPTPILAMLHALVSERARHPLVRT
ncbi:ketopantoate reductase [Rhizobiales bacterium GAS191]|nr:ketopantoate reductase [Rhizobiales bacterium GAS188]SED37037.1 ketopantoate reductase [Rhizobiales bacterium GAS191]